MAQISRDDTIALETAGGQRLRTDVARAFDALVRAYRAKYGENLSITDSFRPYDVQERIFRDRYRKGGHSPYGDYRTWQGAVWGRRAGTAAAAVPGTSNHGAGLAVDITGTGGFGGTVFKRLQSLAPAYGFTNDEGRRVDESWHWGYVRKTSYPKTPTYAAGWPVLYPGDQGDDVKAMQRELIKRGHDLGKAGADGDFGPATVTAVKAFQRSADLTPDARVGDGTQKALSTTKDWFDMATEAELRKIVRAELRDDGLMDWWREVARKYPLVIDTDPKNPVGHDTALRYMLIILRRTERRVVTLDAALDALAKAKGVDPAEIRAAVSASVEKALGDLSITLTTDEKG